jgi:hypoxanthine phosphoribosyltransferase
MGLPLQDCGMQEDLDRVLFEEDAIRVRLDALAAEITAFYSNRELTVLALLNGSLIFAADLLRRVPLPLRIDCLRVSSYHGGTESSGVVTFDEQTLPDLRGRHVLVLDDILDTGRTLHAVLERLSEVGAPLSAEACVLLSKRRPRAAHCEPRFVGFEMEDEFVVGYGLDYRECYRNLPYIGVLKPQIYCGSGPG